MSDYLHIVCLDAPSPPDYGGAIDMFYKVKALAQTGRKVILHYYDYHPLRNTKGLEDVCFAVHAYKRKSFLRALPLSRPFITGSRMNEALLKRLNEDRFPILLEGLHCSGILPHVNNPGRVVLRMHNDEADYYRHLARTENSFLKRLYFKQESRLLTTYQRALNKNTKLACLSEADTEIFKTGYGFHTASFVPCFIPWQTLSIKGGAGDYCLYHGNMGVSENEEAALWLLQHVFNKGTAPLVVAGKSISKRMKNEAARYKHVSLLNNPSIELIDELIQNAQVNVLPSLNGTGVKLKLLNALLNGRHCLTNAAGAKGSGIGNAVTVCNDARDWIRAVQSSMQSPFTQKQTEDRKAILHLYDNHKNAEKLNALWRHCQ